MFMNEDINLLPQSEKKFRRSVFYWRVVGRFLTRLIVVLMFALFALLALWAVNFSTRGGLEDSLAVDLEQSSAEREAMDINRFIGVFQMVLDEKPPFLPKVMELIEGLPDGIRLTGLELDRVGTADDPEQAVFIVEGLASSTTAIVAFQKALEDLEWTNRVEAPLQNFATEPGGAFSFILYFNNSDG